MTARKCAPPPAAQPVERVAGEAEALAGKIAHAMSPPHNHLHHQVKAIALPLVSEALAAARESDLHHAECKALIEEQRDALAAKDRDRQRDLDVATRMGYERGRASLQADLARLSKGLYDLSPPLNPAFSGDAVTSALNWIAALQADLAAKEATVRRKTAFLEECATERETLRARADAAEASFKAMRIERNKLEWKLDAAEARVRAQEQIIEMLKDQDVRSEARVREAEGLLRALLNVLDCGKHEETPADSTVNCVVCQAARFLAAPAAPADEKGGPCPCCDLTEFDRHVPNLRGICKNCGAHPEHCYWADEAAPPRPDPPAAPPVADALHPRRCAKHIVFNCEWCWPVPATPEPSKPPHDCPERVSLYTFCACHGTSEAAARCPKCKWPRPERVVGEAGTVEKLTPLAREVFPMAAAIEAGTVGGKHEFVMPHGKGDTCAFWCKADFESPASYCGKPASDPVHQEGR